MPHPSWVGMDPEYIRRDIAYFIDMVSKIEPINVICDGLDYRQTMTAVRRARWNVRFRRNAKSG